MYKVLASLLLSLVFSNPAMAELTVVAAESGIFEWPEEQPDEEDVAWTNRLEDIRSVEKVEARIGVKFGIRYTVVGKTETGAKVNLLYLTPGVVHPDGSRHDKYEVAENLKPNKTHHVIAYKFTDEYELVPGEWRLMVFQDDRLLIQKSFEVVLP